jgi:hypothetical protein
MNPQIEQIQPDVFNKLASEPYFAAVSLFLIRQERFESEINEALSSAAFDARQAGKLPGATIEVLMPLVKTRLGNAPGPVVTLEQRLTVRENPTINLGSGGTGLTAEELCQAILQTLHQFQLDGVCQAFYPAAECVTPRRDSGRDGLVAYDVIMQATCPLNAPARTGTPPPPAEGPPLTLTFTAPASDPSATIYYTTDGSFPGPGNGAAAVYGRPFSVASGTVVRWAAYIAGKLGSSTGLATINS